MQRQTAKRLYDALAAARAVEAFQAGRSFEDFRDDVYFQSAVQHQLTIVGEALNQLRRAEPAFEGRIRGLHAWVGLRNRLVHAYDSVEPKIVWDIIRLDLDRLITDLEAAMETAPPPQRQRTEER